MSAAGSRRQLLMGTRFFGQHCAGSRGETALDHTPEIPRSRKAGQA